MRTDCEPNVDDGGPFIFIVALMVVSLVGYVVIWWFFPEWVGMSGKKSSDKKSGLDNL